MSLYYSLFLKRDQTGLISAVLQKGENGIMKASTIIGSIFEILERNLYNAILRIASSEERINSAMVYETIWTWFIKDFENEKAGITDGIQNGEYVRKLMNPKSGKDISYHYVLTFSPSLVCQEGLEDVIEYCKLDRNAKPRIVEDFKAFGAVIKKGYIAKDVTALLNEHIQSIIRRKKGLLR